MDQATVEILVAFFTPLIVALFKQAGWPTYLNSIVAIIVYVIFGVGAVAMSGEPGDLNNIVPTVATFVAIGTTAYVAFWRNVGEPALAAKTSIVR